MTCSNYVKFLIFLLRIIGSISFQIRATRNKWGDVTNINKNQCEYFENMTWSTRKCRCRITASTFHCWDNNRCGCFNRTNLYKGCSMYVSSSQNQVPWLRKRNGIGTFSGEIINNMVPNKTEINFWENNKWNVGTQQTFSYNSRRRRWEITSASAVSGKLIKVTATDLNEMNCLILKMAGNAFYIYLPTTTTKPKASTKMTTNKATSTGLPTTKPSLSPSSSPSSPSSETTQKIITTFTKKPSSSPASVNRTEGTRRGDQQNDLMMIGILIPTISICLIVLLYVSYRCYKGKRNKEREPFQADISTFAVDTEDNENNYSTLNLQKIPEDNYACLSAESIYTQPGVAGETTGNTEAPLYRTLTNTESPLYTATKPSAVGNPVYAITEPENRIYSDATSVSGNEYTDPPATPLYMETEPE